MKTLYQSLLDYEMALLRVIADCRHVALNTPNHAKAVRQLAEALVSPATTAITLSALPDEELTALQFLVNHQGQAEFGHFTRRYGSVRSMGMARLNRKKPWLNPISAVEGLWYKGFIYRSFQVTEQGGAEFIYIPRDLLPLVQLHVDELAASLLDSGQPNRLTLEPTTEPAHHIDTTGRLQENIFNLLVFLQTRNPKWLSNEQLIPDDEARLEQRLLPALPFASLSQETAFLVTMMQETRLLNKVSNHVKPNRQPARDWLTAPSHTQRQMIQRAWQDSLTWNDLWRVPSLKPQPTGWENDSRSTRRAVLEYLNHLSDDWFSIDEFIIALKQVSPDFQRPDGDYDKWYIQDEYGNFLMGFVNWELVEGALLRYLLTQILPWLGVLDVGLDKSRTEPVAFRITPTGREFLAQAMKDDEDEDGDQTVDAESTVETTTATATEKIDETTDLLPIQIGEDFRIQVPRSASLFDRFQLARFAALYDRKPEQVSYYLTPRSIAKALRNRITIEQILAFLRRASHNHLPDTVVNGLQNWAKRWQSVRLQPVVLLHLREPHLIHELRQYPDLEPYLTENLSDQTIAVPVEQAKTVERLLVELGYLA
ncbi:helicase-associated domain-containing protein [Anaerolineales bacterium HSG6]|nr:helicase-associated domain-containing protein [Anaerolineales bacterium HSG6]MDM8530841.1 helicase-associated domain-containing protein [Anaerolineales bacterium HSG25]